MEFRFEGLDELLTQLKENATAQDVKDAVRLNTSEMQKAAKRAAPKDTRYLMRNIRQDSSINGGLTGKVESAAEYAAYQEYGTRYQTGKPHIRPAFHKQKQQFKKDLERLTK
jgi:HK97 gp10 family phage protein